MFSLDVADLKSFYAAPLGGMVRRLVGVHVAACWGPVVGLSLLGLGYAGPYLAPYRAGAMRTLAFMPAEQGVVAWPDTGACASALVACDHLPLPSGAVHRALMVHALEMSEQPGDMLREVWRVLEPSGRLLLIVPSRRGWWAGAEWTPFGHGQPYSRGQLSQLLRETHFTPLSFREALYLPPTRWPTLLRAAPAIERMGRVLGLPLAGLTLVEATKQVYSVLPAKRALKLRAQFQPVLLPVPGRAPRQGPPEPAAPASDPCGRRSTNRA